MKHITGKSQHRFTTGRLCLTNLIAFSNTVTCLVDGGRAVDIVYLELSEAFDRVSHSLFLEKLIVLESRQAIGIISTWKQ